MWTYPLLVLIGCARPYHKHYIFQIKQSGVGIPTPLFLSFCRLLGNRFSFHDVRIPAEEWKTPPGEFHTIGLTVFQTAVEIR